MIKYDQDTLDNVLHSINNSCTTYANGETITVNTTGTWFTNEQWFGDGTIDLMNIENIRADKWQDMCALYEAHTNAANINPAVKEAWDHYMLMVHLTK